MSAGRLGWLDALRGVAALCVAWHHASYHYQPELRAGLLEWVDLGTYGVLVFFLVSGYIIPASLERTGSLRRFWIGRIFRIQPLLLLALLLAVLPAMAGLVPWRAGLDRVDPWAAVLAHLVMLQDLTAVPNAINVLWTLSYEMVFYLLVAGLFVLGAHRRPVEPVLVLAAATVLLGGVLPAMALTDALGVPAVAGTAAIIVAASVLAACGRNPVVRTAGALTGAGTGLVLVAVNGRIPSWQGLAVLTVMFTGTVLYRPLNAWIKAGTVTVAGAAVLGAGVWFTGRDAGAALPQQRAWAAAVLLAAGTFAAAFALRNRRMPRLLTGLGVISYSVYLLHPVLLVAADAVVGRPGHDRPLWIAAFLVVLLGCCTVTHRLVEAPMQRLGRRLAARDGTTKARPPDEPGPGPAERRLSAAAADA